MLVTFICATCGKQNTKRKKNDRVYKYCNRECAKLTRFQKDQVSWNKGLPSEKQPMFGKRSGNWRGGRHEDGHGYVLVFAKKHPCANKSGYVREHRLAIEETLGFYLDKPNNKGDDLIVHHINGNTLDNKPDNLQIMTRSEHTKYHRGK